MIRVCILCYKLFWGNSTPCDSFMLFFNLCNLNSSETVYLQDFGSEFHIVEESSGFPGLHPLRGFHPGLSSAAPLGLALTQGGK